MELRNSPVRVWAWHSPWRVPVWAADHLPSYFVGAGYDFGLLIIKCGAEGQFMHTHILAKAPQF